MRAEEQLRIRPEEPWWKEEVVYQIYPRSFKDSNGDGIGDIRGILEKLDYLKALGITMLWLCPIYQSPMDDNGYDVSDYCALAPEFGTMEELDELIERAGDMGIKIILDLVINHTSDEHRWFRQALEDPEGEEHGYYIFKEGDREPNNWRSVFGGSVWEKVEGRSEYYFHAFGKKQPDLNWENETLRKKLYEMVNWWLEKGIAGFRIDAITFIKKDLTFADQEPDGADGRAKCTKASRNQPGIGEFLNELKRETFDRHGCVTVAEAPGVPYEGLGDFIGRNGYFSMIFDFRYADLDIASGSEWFKRREWTVEELKDKIMASQMAVQTYGWGANFTSLQPTPEDIYPLKQYKGFYHVYLSGDSLLWIKDYQRLMCINLHNERYIANLDSVFQQKGMQHPIEDLFADERGLVWVISHGELLQPELSFRLKLSEGRGTIQDLTADEESLYLFHDTGEIVCYDVKNGKQQYDIAAYPRTEQEKFQNTSLILRGKNGFYQLRNGSKGGFFHFDLHKRAWEKLMETEYTLNTLMISADEKAYISCIRGFWIIDPEKRTRHYMPTLRTRKGNVLATEISTIFQDRQGALWFGTFNRGLLYYHPALYKHIHIDKKDFPLSLERNTAVANI